MSKKNNKQKSKEYHAFIAEQEKEVARRMQKKQERKMVNKQTRFLADGLSNFGINEDRKSENDEGDVQMTNTKYRRPKKAQRIRRRERIVVKH